MNRVVKFRAWIESNEYDEQGQHKMTHDLAFEEYAPLNKLLEGVDHLMQFTGVKDLNGVDIYEGDLWKDKDGLVYEICFDGFNAKFSSRTKGGRFPKREDGFTYFDYDIKKIEVIGNIHQNRNLL